jgi:hypothetical protein
MPAPSPGHPLATPLLLRTLRLNCLTTAYSDLRAELYEDFWRDRRPGRGLARHHRGAARGHLPGLVPTFGKYEAVTWFDATGRKLVGNWNTFGAGQTKEHWEQFQRSQEDPVKNPVPDGYTAPFYKAGRIAEDRQAHAAFTARLGWAG